MRRGVALVADDVEAKWREIAGAEPERAARPHVHWLRDLYIASSSSVVVLPGRMREREAQGSRPKAAIRGLAPNSDEIIRNRFMARVKER